MADETPLRAEAERLLQGITPGPWAWEWIGEKSNEWAVGQAWREDGTAIEGRLPEGEWLEDTVIERRLVGMNESGHARAADAEFIAAAPRLVRDLLAQVQTLQQGQEKLVALVGRWREKGEAELAAAAETAADKPAPMFVASMRLHCADELEDLLPKGPTA